MGFLGKIFSAINAFFATLLIGGLQGKLLHQISHSGVDSPQSKQLITKIVSAAWSMEIISIFYQSLGFTKQVLEIMYFAAVRGAPNLLFKGRDLFATHCLIHDYRNFGHELHRISKSVEDKAGPEREQEFIKQIRLQIQKLQECLASAKL